MAASSTVQHMPVQQVKPSLPDDGEKRFLVRRRVCRDICLPEGPVSGPGSSGQTTSLWPS